MRGGEQSALFQARCQARDGRYRWAKADLDMVAAATKGVDGYLIEIVGYASKTGTQEENQKHTDSNKHDAISASSDEEKHRTHKG